MLWKRTTQAAGFWGFLIGILSAMAEWVWIHLLPADNALHWRFDMANVYKPHVADITRYADAGGLAQNTYLSFWALAVTLIAVVAISLFTKPKTDEELANLVIGLTPRVKDDGPLTRRPIFWAGVVALVLIAINLVFW
jgi:SSS family solute:Na+ symporter